MKGGDLFIGVNDDGYVVGLKDSRYFLDTLPNQVIAHLGIMGDVGLIWIMIGTK